MNQLQALKNELALKVIEYKVSQDQTLYPEQLDRLTKAAKNSMIPVTEYVNLCSNLVGIAFPNPELTRLYTALLSYR